MPNKLPSDEYRCCDFGCGERHYCARFLQRKAEGAKRMASLFPYDIPLCDPCPARIPAEGEEE